MGLVHNTNVVSDGLVCCWDAANKRSYPGAGTTWTDLVGRQNGTMQNNTSFNSAKGGVLEFDGTDDYVSVPDSDYLDSITSAITVSVWVYWSSDANDISTIVSKASAAGWSSPYSSWNMRLRHGTGGWGTDAVEFWAAGSYTTGGQFYSSSSIPRDTWTHIVGTYDGANQKIYINGVLDGTEAETAAIAATSYPLYIGVNSGDIGEDFEGSLANVLIYNRGLTAAEVKQNYEATKPRFAPRITKRGMKLNFDAGDPASYPGGTSWKDTANGLSTTFHNMDASNFNSSNGGYFAFDGTDEYMSVLNSPLFQGAIADQGTFAAWFNIDEAGDDADPNIAIWGAGRNGSKMTWTMAQFDSSKKPLFGAYLGGSWSDIGVADTALSYDTWYYVVFTWDKANTQVKSYVNGALDDTDTTSSASITTSTAGWLGIGASLYNTTNGNTPYNFLPGFIGVLQLYDSVLSAAEIMDNYNATKGRFT